MILNGRLCFIVATSLIVNVFRILYENVVTFLFCSSPNQGDFSFCLLTTFTVSQINVYLDGGKVRYYTYMVSNW